MELPTRIHACSFVDFSSLRNALRDKTFLPSTSTIRKINDRPQMITSHSRSTSVGSEEDGSQTDRCHDQAVQALFNNQEKDVESEDPRLARRRYLNKLAAQRCRDKKRTQAEELKEETERLECRNTELKHTVRKLLRQKDELLFLLKTHAQTFHPGEDIVKGAVSEGFVSWSD